MKTSQQRIEDLENIIPKIDGQTLFDNLGNRAYGLGIALLGSYLTYKEPLAGIIGAPLIIEGVGDLVSGKHHYISFRLFKAHPKDEIRILKQEIEK